MDTIINLDGRELTAAELQQVMGGTRHHGEYEHHGRRHRRDYWYRDCDYSWWYNDDDDEDCWD